MAVTPTERAWSFSYRASDGLSVSPFQSVTGTNARPSAAPLALPVPSTASTVTLTGIDANGDALTFAIASPPADATLGEIGDPTCTNRPDGSSLCTADVAFTPGAGDSWSFSYTVDDGVGPSFTATAFLVRASGADEPPLAVSTGVGLLPGANAITLQGSDPEGADVTFAIATPPASGTLGPIGPVSCAGGTCTATVTYTPDDATVDDSFTFRANDGTLDSEPATVSLSGNAPPIAHGMSLNYTADTPLPFQLVGSDAESQPLTFALTAGPTHGTLSALSAPDCSFGSCTVDVTYTPNAGYDGNDSITFSVSDGIHPAVEASVTLIGNQAPLAFAGSAKIAAPATTLVLEGFDAELATLEFSVSTAPTFGTLALDGQPSCDGFGMCTQTATYTPSPGSTDPDAFEFTVSDGSNSSEPAMFTLVRDEPPIAVDDSVTVIGSVPAAIFPLSNDFDSTSDPLTITAYDQTGTAGGAVACDPFGECTYTPAAGFFGTDTFTYEISDGTFTDTATVTVIVRGAAIISNGTVTLGVWGEGHLNVPGPDRPVGLRYEPTGNESTAPGCECEGWGVADATTATAGYANESTDGGPVNLDLVSFTSDASTATSVVDVDDVLRVTHAYRPSATSPNLYEVAVTIENRSAAPVEPRYRRVMDWDVEPTPFSEFVTIETGTASGILFTSDNGFASANPLGPRGQIAVHG